VFHLDTNVVIWMADRAIDRISGAALAAIEIGPVSVSPIVLLELQYLHDIGRATTSPDNILLDLAGLVDLTISDVSFAAVVSHSRRLTWTRDPFDRLVVGAALAEQARLVTANRLIRKNLPGAVW